MSAPIWMSQWHFKHDLVLHYEQKRSSVNRWVSTSAVTTVEVKMMSCRRKPLNENKSEYKRTFWKKKKNWNINIHFSYWGVDRNSHSSQEKRCFNCSSLKCRDSELVYHSQTCCAMHIEWPVDYGCTFNGISQGGYRNARHVPIIYERAMWAEGHLQWKHCLVRADRTGTLVLFHGALVLAQACQPIRLLPVRAMLVCFLVVLSHTSIHSFILLPSSLQLAAHSKHAGIWHFCKDGSDAIRDDCSQRLWGFP